MIKIDQTRFIIGRQGLNNIRKILNIISSTKYKPQTCLMLSLDAQKAFDGVKFSFLYQTLSAFRFPQSFIECAKIIYKDPKSELMAAVQISSYLGEESDKVTV